jgi:tetratricopeptide (TPR) repeat protein
MQRHPMALLGLLATVWLACGAPEAQAADFAGASQVVVRVMAAIAAPAAAAVPTDDGKMVALANDLAGLRAGWTNMTPDAAAARWLSLADRLYELQSADPNNPFRASIMHDWDEYVMAGEIAGGSTGTVTLVTLLDSLPGPPAWSALRAQIESRSATTPAEQKRNLTLMLMANLLLDDRAGFDAVIKDGDARFRKIGDRSVSDVKSVLEHLRRAAVQRNLRTPADAVNAFRQVIDLPLDPEAGAVDVQVPDLVGIAGEKEARILLNKAIRVPYLKFRVPGGGSTLSLLKEVVAADIASLQRPQWALINSSADVSLFEAMDRKFPARSADEDSEDVMSMVTDGGRYGRGEQDYERRGALGYYLLALIEAGRIDDAVSATLKAAEAEGFELNLNLDVRSLTDSNAVSRLAQYCEGVLVKRSVESLWPVYTAVANRAGCGEAALKLLRQSMADPTAGPESLVRLQRHYLAALLAMDRVDEAAAFCREAIKTRKPGVRERAYESAQIPLRLAQLGRLLGRKDWVSEGVAAMLQSDPAGSNQGMVGFRYMYDDETLLAFKEAGRLADIEALAVEALAMGLRESQQNIDMMEAVQILGPLAAVYDAAGRPADVMALLEHAPWWGVEDVCELVSQDSLQMPVLHALVATDRTRDAARFARLILVTKPDDDNVYSVLVDVEGINCLPFLEDLSQRDRFQERPLIWKAEVLRRTGQLDAAEAAARAALQIDPTDGEQHAGDRVRVYSVLAAILEAGGKKSDAAFFSNVVESVRMAEEGDRFTEMGLLERSLPLYEQAEVLFGAAYCVQWRLAERLQAMGRTAEAEMHYAIAFERMPEQFGRVASFCFGCEGAFRSGASRSAAERVLSGLLDKEPVRPQVYYLMGLLREAQDRKSEAADYFKKALEKDPEYFDAMRALLNLASVVFMTQDERNSLMLRMLALDPLQRHGTYIKEISDFKALWDRVGQAQRLRLKPETGIFPLAASKAHLAAQADAMRQQVQASGLPVNVYIGMSRRSMAMERSGMFTVPTFGETLMGHELMSKIVPLLQPSGNNGIY